MTTDFSDYIRKQMAELPYKRRIDISFSRFASTISMLIYNYRKESQMTQAELAEVIDTKQSAIARLEDADYDGHSLKLLFKIADALGKELVVDMKPKMISSFASVQAEWSIPSTGTIRVSDRTETTQKQYKLLLTDG